MKYKVYGTVNGFVIVGGDSEEEALQSAYDTQFGYQRAGKLDAILSVDFDPTSIKKIPTSRKKAVSSRRAGKSRL